jgi:endonuclease/exonuclease/phosphatase (EEP) superfamily protein YafD
MLRPPFRILLRLAALLALAGTAAAIGFGYLGHLHPAFDSFSHFRIHLAAGLLVSAPVMLLLRYRPEALLAAVFGVAAIAGTLDTPISGAASAGHATAAPEGPVFRLLHLNLRFNHSEPSRVLSLIGRVQPDIVTLNEVSAMWGERLALLEAAYPHRIICNPPRHVGGAAILSRRPFAEGFSPRCDERGALALARIDLAGREAEFASLHLSWPWPFGQQRQLALLEPDLAMLGDTAVLAGDLNAVRWSDTARRLARMTDMRLLSGIGPTWLFGTLPDVLRRHAGLPIDNVLVKGGLVPLSVEAIEDAGSDHLPVLLTFTVLAPGEPAEVLHAGLAPLHQ